MPTTTKPDNKELDEVTAKLHVLGKDIEKLETERDILIQEKRVLEQHKDATSNELETFHNHLMGDPSITTLLFLHLYKLEFRFQDIELELVPHVSVPVLLAYDFLMTWYTTENISDPARSMADHIKFFDEFKAVTKSYYRLLGLVKDAGLINFKHGDVWILPKGQCLVESWIHNNLIQGADEKAKIVLNTFIQEGVIT